jgi:transcription termination factor Rho
MSVLQRQELEDSPLADLHAIASELGLESFRAMRRDDLIAAILAAQGVESEDKGAGAESEDDLEPDEVPSDEALEGPPGEPVVEEPAAEEPEPAPAEEPEPAPAEEPEPAPAEEPVAAEPEPEEVAAGVLDILANGSGFVRIDTAGQSRGDVYVSPAQIRRCELRAGDTVSGPVRPPRRNERHPSLVRVESVNGGPAEPPEERPWFGDLTPVFASARLPAPSAFEDYPYGRGSRVAIVGPSGAGATTLLRAIADELHGVEDLDLQVVLVGVRPEEVTEWRSLDGVDVVGGGFDRSPEAQSQAAELAIERAKRHAERAADAAVLIDSLDALPGGAQRRLFGAARATEEGGSVTVIATAGQGSDALRWATTRVVLAGGGAPAGAQSMTLRAERLSSAT